MPETALDEPIHLNIHPDEPIRSLDAAAKVIHRHAGDRLDARARARAVLRRMADASTPAAVAGAAHAFREWARAEGLLLVPPEDK
jgi:hypothetical protein